MIYKVEKKNYEKVKITFFSLFTLSETDFSMIQLSNCSVFLFSDKNF